MTLTRLFVLAASGSLIAACQGDITNGSGSASMTCYDSAGELTCFPTSGDADAPDTEHDGDFVCEDVGCVTECTETDYGTRCVMECEGGLRCVTECEAGDEASCAIECTCPETEDPPADDPPADDPPGDELPCDEVGCVTECTETDYGTRCVTDCESGLHCVKECWMEGEEEVCEHACECLGDEEPPADDPPGDEEPPADDPPGDELPCDEVGCVTECTETDYGTRCVTDCESGLHCVKECWMEGEEEICEHACECLGAPEEPPPEDPPADDPPADEPPAEEGV